MVVFERAGRRDVYILFGRKANSLRSVELPKKENLGSYTDRCLGQRNGATLLGVYPLMAAVTEDFPMITKMLLTSRANVNIKCDGMRETALMRACKSANFQLQHLLAWLLA